MNPRIERILATIEVLIEKPFDFDLPCHEHGSKIEAYGWDTSLYKNFSPLSLLLVEKWLVPTDPETALAEWKHIEETQVASPTIDIDEDEREEAGITLDEHTKSARFQAYRDLFSYLTANLDSLHAYTLSYNSDYSLSAIAGKLPDNRWICLSPTVPQETGKYPIEEMRCIPLENEEAIAPVSDVETQISEIAAKLNPIKIFGWYGGGYEHLHDYQIIYATGDTLESALQKCLMKAGLIEVYKFDRFFARVNSCGYDAENNKGMGDRFERLNSFMKATFTDLRMYRICFWDWEHLYFFDAQQEDDKAGIVIRSQFICNP